MGSPLAGGSRRGAPVASSVRFQGAAAFPDQSVHRVAWRRAAATCVKNLLRCAIKLTVGGPQVFRLLSQLLRLIERSVPDQAGRLIHQELREFPRVGGGVRTGSRTLREFRGFAESTRRPGRASRCRY